MQLRLSLGFTSENTQRTWIKCRMQRIHFCWDVGM